MADQVYATISGRVRNDVREISGNSDSGPYAFSVVELLDGDDNKVEITLPDDGVPKLVVGSYVSADCRFSVRRTNRGSFLSVTAKKVQIVDTKTGELRSA